MKAKTTTKESKTLPLMDNKEVAALLHTSPNMVMRYILGLNKLPKESRNILEAEHFKVGRVWLWNRKSLYQVLGIQEGI